MAELDLTNIANASIATPASGVTAHFVDTTTKLPLWKIDTGAMQGSLSNQSVTTPAGGFASDTYLVGSSILVPNGFFRIGTAYKLTFDVTKTGAGTATAILIVRIGTNASVADTAILTFTFTAQTGVIDNGTFSIFAIFRTVGSGTSAVMQGTATLNHKLAATGLTSTPAGYEQLYVTSSGFNSTTTGVTIGTSINGGTSAVWTVTLVRAELVNL